ncbi:hypothetical protein SK128_025355 [Halocaridina rubra]|uniref:Uncharacterized protein n=1 Tax=Halocaridina rubra TaxID=373956 RepID=A0AAN8WJU7_HALRR
MKPEELTTVVISAMVFSQLMNSSHPGTFEIYQLNNLPTNKLPKNVSEESRLKFNPTTLESHVTAPQSPANDPVAITTEGTADMEDVQNLQESRKDPPQSPDGASPKKTIIDLSLISQEHTYMTLESQDCSEFGHRWNDNKGKTKTKKWINCTGDHATLAAGCPLKKKVRKEILAEIRKARKEPTLSYSESSRNYSYPIYHYAK